MIRNKLRSIRPKHIKRLVAGLVIVFSMSSALPVFATNIPYGIGDYSKCPYNASSANCDISISNNSFSMFLNTIPSIGGTCSVQSDQVTVNTYDPSGYTLTLGDQASTNASLVNIDNSSYYISPTTGTLSSPVALTDAWGYRVDNLGLFGTGTTAQNDVSPNSSQYFAQVEPSSYTPDTIASSSALNPSAATNVWYGVCLDNNHPVPAGLYTNSVLYTATAN